MSSMPKYCTGWHPERPPQRSPLMTSPGPVPIFDGHNDILLRLYKRGGADAPRAFLDGEAKGQLDLPKARHGGFAGGVFSFSPPAAGGGGAPRRRDAVAKRGRGHPHAAPRRARAGATRRL